jgi:hypothetical protein
MKEVTFADRVPTYPGRVVLTPVDGQANTFDMVRADDPIIEGTMLNKATFNSMIHSRLTGRYYLPTVARETVSSQDVTVNPIPASGWLNATTTTANLNGYEIYATAASSQSELITSAFDGNPNTYWLGLNNDVNYIGFKLPSAVQATKLKMKFAFTSGDINEAKIQASNDWQNWDDVSGTFYVGNETVMTEREVNAKKPYYYYRVLLSIYQDAGIYCYGLELAGYNVSTHRNAFTVENVPTVWTPYQRITIVTPADVNAMGIIENTLNGVRLDAILQPNKYYELIYNGSYFWVWGVA